MRPPALVGRRVCGGVLVVVLAVAALSCVRRPSAPAPVLGPVREAAYRANNRGVALLEREMPNLAVDAFREALAGDPDMQLAAVNLPIALYYAGRDAEAEKASAAARARYPDAPQPLYILGLVAQAANRLDEALAAYSSLRQLDPGDVAALVQMSRIYNQRQEYEAATAMADAALTAEPYNATAAYNLALARARSGDREGGARAAARFQTLTAAPYGITYTRSYLSQGRHAEALVSTGLESDLVGPPTPGVTFVRVSDALPARRPPALSGVAAATAGRNVTLADIDGDGDLDVIAASDVLRVLRNDGMRFTDVTARTGLALPGIAILGAVAGDIDNDGTQDVLLLTGTGPRIFAGRKSTAFEAFPERALPADAPAPAHAAALTDVDHDGDLDIVIGGSQASSQLLRNNGNGTFENVTVAAGLAGVSGVVAIAPTDFDKRRDIDLLLLAGNAPRLFRNLRSGAFADVAAESGLPGRGDYTVATLGDVNKDGTADIFLGRRSGPGLLALSTGRGAFRVEETPPDTSSARVAQLLDYDNDGLLDLIVGGTSGLRIWRWTGAAWDDRTAMVFPEAPAPAEIASLATGDLDDDGDLDLLAVAVDGELRLMRNDGGSRNRSLRVSLASLVSNRSGVGSKVDLRAGSLYQSVETSATTPPIAPASLLFGLGGRADADVVRVLWPAGILQAEPVTARAANARMTIRELDRKPSSCPYLFVWDGTRFVFVTDFLGGGEMGYWLAPGVRNVPNPVEYVRITDTRLKPRNGRLELRITNELEEVLFLDTVRLLAIPHDAGTEIYPDEGLRAAPPRPRVFAVREIQPLARAADDHGHDVRAAVASVDRRVPDDFARLPIRGYAHPHTLTLALPPLTPRSDERVVLLLTGSTDYAFSRDNVAGHQAGYALVPPTLQQQLPDGTWAMVTPDVGVPVGRPQTIVVDVTGVAPGRAMRLTTTMSIYWDRIAVGVATAHSIDETTAIPPLDVHLRWRGYSAPVAADRSSAVYDYGSVGSNAPWKLMPGRYTREGEVGELVDREDDRLVISRSGDELAVAFDASRFPPLARGQRRTYLLRAVGYSKEMDLHSASPDEAGPLPFKKMSGYPYPASESYPHPDDIERFHTRVVPRPIPSLDRILTTAP
jgi:hypothetical protein